MIPVFKLKDLKRKPNDPNARARCLEALRRWKEADDRLAKVCDEKGIPIPVMVCSVPDTYGSQYYTTSTKSSSRVTLAAAIFR